jgi:hypothetical protein
LSTSKADVQEEGRRRRGYEATRGPCEVDDGWERRERERERERAAAGG